MSLIRTPQPIYTPLADKDGKITQPWSQYLLAMSQQLTPPGTVGVQDGTVTLSGPTTIYQAALVNRGQPNHQDLFFSLDTGATYTVGAAGWQLQVPALSGDVTTEPFSTVTTLASVNPAQGTFGNSTTIPVITVNAKGLVTNVQETPITTALAPGLDTQVIINDGGSFGGTTNFTWQKLINTLTLGVDGIIAIDNIAAAPATPASGLVELYAKSNGFLNSFLYTKDDTGLETQLGINIAASFAFAARH